MVGNDGRQVSRATIHAIPTDVCRKICTGQVIITLAGACKELIDNSLDAESKTLGLFMVVNNEMGKKCCSVGCYFHDGIVRMIFDKKFILQILNFRLRLNQSGENYNHLGYRLSWLAKFQVA